jgi:hypothetical protein
VGEKEPTEVRSCCIPKTGLAGRTASKVDQR